jgi:hypothetical protein
MEYPSMKSIFHNKFNPFGAATDSFLNRGLYPRLLIFSHFVAFRSQQLIGINYLTLTTPITYI